MQIPLLDLNVGVWASEHNIYCLKNSTIKNMLFLCPMKYSHCMCKVAVLILEFSKDKSVWNYMLMPEFPRKETTFTENNN